MQDWNYEHVGCMEITLELSDVKYPRDEELDGFWEDNREALISYMEHVHTGIYGLVSDNQGNPLPAAVSIKDGKGAHTEPKTGMYHKLLASGSYHITASSEGYRSKAKNIEIPKDQNIYDAVRVDFVLEKL
jgi:hypothetical protein